MHDATSVRVPPPGLSEAQLARLEVLERSARLTGWQAGEARALAQLGTPSERERALRVVERVIPTPKLPNVPSGPVPRNEEAVAKARQIAEQRGWAFEPNPAVVAGTERRGVVAGTERRGWI
jgi:hypothetical protein